MFVFIDDVSDNHTLFYEILRLIFANNVFLTIKCLLYLNDIDFTSFGYFVFPFFRM